MVLLSLPGVFSVNEPRIGAVVQCFWCVWFPSGFSEDDRKLKVLLAIERKLKILVGSLHDRESCRCFPCYIRVHFSHDYTLFVFCFELGCNHSNKL